MASIPVQVQPVVLADSYCPTAWKALNLDIMRARWSVDLGSISTFVTGTSSPDESVYPDSIWIKLDAQGAPVRAYKWSQNLARWISPHPVPPGNELRMFTATLEELKLYEGDAASSVSPIANPTFEGPFWEPVLELSGRTPIGVNDATTGGPDLTLPPYALGAINTGSETTPLGTALLTFDNLPHHAHGLGDKDDASENMGFIYKATGMTVDELYGVPTLTVNWDCEDGPLRGTARSVSIVKTFTMDAANSQTSSREVAGVNVLPPVRGLYFIRRTQRLYYSEL
jgi:hypothetical protein